MDYRDIIESRYDRKAWQELLHDIFRSKVSFWREPSAVHASSRLAKQALNLGKISLADGESIAIYEIELTDNVDIERNRRGIRDMLTTDWRNMGYAGAFMFCYRQNESVLRFSYVSESWSFADDGTYKKDSTDTRRFTYLLGEGHRSRTAIQQFEGLKKSGLSLKDLTKAFSVDAVSDMFFDDYKQQYEDIIAFITGKRMVKVSNKWEERVVGEPNETIFSEFRVFADPEKAIRDYVKKLMGRLVFLQFLQKKGWLGVPVNAKWGDGDREFIQHLFENAADKDTFVDNVLEPLFNDINSERKGDIASSAVGKDIRVPYLNGGLFEPDAADAVNFPLPARFMKSMLDFFASYNFTIDENDPDDAEMGVDPEMLGRIFENLLEDNKDKGAFYTPKEIVNYMCRESLIAYLQTNIEKEEQKEAIRQFVTTHQFVEHLPSDTLEMLKNVKICDPAIGSGAFPMGLLKELYLCRATLEGFDQKKAAEIKKHIIQQNIYGVDIERGAVDTARLRFWLALIVDEESPEALPNLDFKIMQGNSLLESFHGVELNNLLGTQAVNQARIIFDEESCAQELLLKSLRDFYSCSEANQKKALRAKINAQLRDLLRTRITKPELQNEIDTLGAQNDKFFLWHTWFNDVFAKGGFDIVIGNPPYVNIANIKDDALRKCYQANYKTVKNKSDLYSIFTERAHRLLKDNGHCSFIFSNSWMGTDSFSIFRHFLIDETKIINLVDLPDKVFKNATVRTCIILFSKCKVLNHAISLIDFDGKTFLPMHRPLTYNEIKKYEHYPFSFEKGIDLNRVKNILLRDIATFTLGIKTSNDKRFVSSRPFPEDSYKLIRGRNLQRYNKPIAEEWIWYRPDLFMEKKGAGPRKLEYFIVDKKIVIQDIAQEICATIDFNQYLCADSINVIYSLKKGFSFEYILGLLNSKLIRFWNKRIFPEGLHIKKYQLEVIPIPIPTKEIQNKIEAIVNTILNAKANYCDEDTSNLEHDLDRLVYNLYALTDEEIRLIEQ